MLHNACCSSRFFSCFKIFLKTLLISCQNFLLWKRTGKVKYDNLQEFKIVIAGVIPDHGIKWCLTNQQERASDWTTEVHSVRFQILDAVSVTFLISYFRCLCALPAGNHIFCVVFVFYTDSKQRSFFLILILLSYSIPLVGRHSDLNLVELNETVKEDDRAVLLEGGGLQSVSPKARSSSVTSHIFRFANDS